jgi:hypothetical protein
VVGFYSSARVELTLSISCSCTVHEMITQLDEQLAAAVRDAKPHTSVDVTLALQVMFSNTDRSIINAKLRYDGEDKGANLIMIVGLRSDILAPFERKISDQKGRYQPCDIPALVPGLALLAQSANNGVVLSAISREEVTRFILVFEGLAERKGGSLKALSSAVTTFMKRWTEWTEVLLGILARDPVVGSWNVDWREMLAGETGFTTMPWFTPLSYSDREIGLQRIVVASQALLVSVLSAYQLKDPMIIGLKEWLTRLKPLPEVMSSVQVSEEVEI